MLALTGNSISPGVAVGRVHRLLAHELEISRYRLKPEQIEDEVDRFHQAIKRTGERLDQLIAGLKHSASAAREFLDTHRLLLNDHDLSAATIQRIRRESSNAEWALTKQRDHIIAAFAEVEDAYLRARIEDVEHVVTMILQSLQQQSAVLTEQLPDQLSGMIVVTSMISPAEVAVLHDRGAAGLILERGSSYAHSAILARSLGIPAVIGVSRALSLLHENEELILDGHYGVVFVQHEEAMRRHYRTKQAERAHQQILQEQQNDQPARTSDGESVRLLVNAERASDVSEALRYGAEGVGLMRTEHFFLNCEQALDEEAQYQAYKTIIDAAAGHLVTIRTLDAGGDKVIAGMQSHNSCNPALGLRAIRLSLHYPELFRTQLRAILRAAVHGPTRILVPMITQANEIRLVRRLLTQCQQELQQKKQAYAPSIDLGAMIEVPAAALAIHSLLPEVQFIAIGTNDLAQYTLAADRLDPEVGYLHDPLHPGFLKLVQWVIEAADMHQIPVSLCGEIAADPRYTPVLLGLGLREFSMHSASIAEVKQEILRTSASHCRQLMQQHLRNPVLESAQLIHYLTSENPQISTLYSNSNTQQPSS